MTLPDGVPTVTVTTGVPLVLPDGTPFTGYLTFTGPDVVTVAGQHVVLGGAAQVDLDGGSFSVDLVPNDVDGMSPAGWTYRVDAVFTNAPGWTRYISLPTSDDDVHLADILIPDPSVGEYTLLLDPSTLGGAAFADVGTTAGTVAAGDDPRFENGGGAGALLAANNLGDLDDAAAARGHLGLGTAAVAAATSFDTTGAAAAAQSAAISAAATDAAGRVSAHVSAVDPHGDRAAASTDASSKASAAQTAAIGAAATDAAGRITAHVAASDPHGDRAAATSALASHVSAVDPHGDRAAAATDATGKVTTHTGASDPHADRAFTTSAVSTHTGATDPHGDRAAASTALSAHTTATTGVHGIADTSALVTTADSRLTNSRAPSGSASGDLTGTFPGPTVAKVNGVAMTGTPSSGYVPTATSGTAATWQALPTASASTAGITKLDGTVGDITAVGTGFAAGATGQAADAGHQHAVQALLPSDNNLLWWTFPPINAGGANVPSAAAVAGRLTLSRVILRTQITVAKIWLGISANDAGATFTNCYLGVYNVSGTLLAQTADISSTLHTSVVNSYSFTAGATLPAGEYFIALLMGSGSTWTTWNLKSSLGGVTANAGLAAPHFNLASLGSGLSALPSTVTLSSMDTALITGGWGSQWYGLS